MKGARVTFDARRIVLAVGRGSLEALRQAGAYLRKSARHRVTRSPKASPVGSPPHTRHGLLKRSILFGIERHRQSVVVGPSAGLMGPVMGAHEFGGRFRGRRYPKRPLMGPTLYKTKDKLPSLWKDSVR